MGYHRSSNMETISETIHARGCLSSMLLKRNSSMRMFRYFRLELLHENFPNNYLLHWNLKQLRFIFENFECINLFLMIHRHFHVILFDVIMDCSLRLLPINHHRSFSNQKNVRLFHPINLIVIESSPSSFERSIRSAFNQSNV